MEELSELREELVDARAEAERLAEELADREARAQTLAEEMTSLRQELETARQEVTQVRSTSTDEARRLAERYRAVLVMAAPDVPADLIQGETVEDLDRSLVAARDLVARVREQMQAQAVARVPAGSPLRGAPDVSGLSPAEKIRLGVSERQ
jgi:chromosome segregation ATPase